MFQTLDPTLYQSLRKLTLSSEDEFVHMEQYFTLPGNESFELLKGGKNRPVVKSNSMQFVKVRPGSSWVQKVVVIKMGVLIITRFLC